MNDAPVDELCFAALVSILEGLENEDEESIAETVDQKAEAVVTAVVGEQLLEKETKPLLEPLAEPWCKDEAGKGTSACENVCDCAMMATAKVSPHVLKNLCSDKCIISFANVK
ncbi:hypothetical protein Hanom_Chr07g00621001 [Helianthus anomalus]